MRLRAPAIEPAALALLLGSLAPAAAPAAEAVVRLLTYDGPITPVASEYIVQGIADAGRDGAAAVVLQLDTPGGLDESMRDIIKAELASAIPVVVFVGPAGSRAASAGAFITVAAHVAVMAPGTNIGSASPVQMMGAQMDSTMAHKVTNDAAAYIASIAEQRGRDAELARSFVTAAANVTAEEALRRGVIDFLAPDLPALLDSLVGRTVPMGQGEVTLPAERAVVEEKGMGPRQKLLKALANPNVAYVLMMLGIYGLFFELSNPGSFAPGIIGGICLLLALFAFQALPVDYTGVALILLGVVLLLLEVKVTSFGALSIGGIAALVLGSLMLFDSPEPWAKISTAVLVPTVLVFAGFFLACVWLAVRSHRRPRFSGPQALVGERGRVVLAIAAGARGKVVVHGEMWDAAAEQQIPAGARVRVAAVQDRYLQVTLDDAGGPGR